MADRKRPLDSDQGSSSLKKFRSDTTTVSTSNGPPDAATLIAQKKAEIAAKFAAMGKTTGIAAVVPPVPAAPTPAPPKALIDSDLKRKVEEAKARVAAATRLAAVSSNPYLSLPQTGKKRAPEPAAPQGAGLKMAAHPLLLDTAPAPAPTSKKDRYKPMVPKFASLKANVKNTPPPPPPPPVVDATKANPYASAAVSGDGFEGAPKERAGRSLKFNQKGKFITLGNQMRQDAQLEELKQRIAESAKKAGLDSEFEVLEKNVRRAAPPAAEWWDASLLPNKTYDDLAQGMSDLNIRNADSPITLYVQHPIPIPASGDKNKVQLKAMHLTKKEQKKLRKQRRQAELQDKQDRIRMGLIPPDPPKVRLSNLMKVLTTDAVQDPTKVEARVRREVAQRKHAHEKMNEERKLTDEQRREKIENKKLNEEKKGICGAVFRVQTLTDPSHQFKVRKNAEQMNLSGLCIYHSAFSVVYVEGAHKFIKQYKNVMLRRIKWTEHARQREDDDVEDDAEDADNGNSKGKGKEVEAVSLEGNRCDLIWEGDLRERAFKNFRTRACPSESLAKEALGSKLASFWDSAKNWKPQEDEW